MNSQKKTSQSENIIANVKQIKKAPASNSGQFFKKTAVVIPGAIISSLLFGSAYPAIKIGYNLFNIQSNDTGSQILFAGIRFIIAGLMVILIGSLINKKLLLPDKKTFIPIMKISLLETVGQYILFYVGLALTTGVRGSIMVASNVFMALIVSTLIFHLEKLTWKKIVGSVLGFAGVIIVNLTGSSLGGTNALVGDIMILISTICYALSSSLINTFDKNVNMLVISSYQLFFGGLIMSAVGLIMGGKLTCSHSKGLFILLYLSFVSAAAFSILSVLLKNNPVSRVTVFGFLSPVSGVILSAVFLNESSGITFLTILSLILICIGIFMVNTAEKQLTD